jgi:hypothetical protein
MTHNNQQLAFLLLLGVVGCSAQDSTCIAASGSEGLCDGDTPSHSVMDDIAPALNELDTLEYELTLGSRGEQVQAVHGYLKNYGYFPNPELSELYPAWHPRAEAPANLDEFDEHSAAAVLAFQRRFRLEQTGIVDEPTLARMRRPRCGVPDGIAAFDPSNKYNAKGGTNVWNDPNPITWRVVNAPLGKTVDEVTEVAKLAFKPWGDTTSIRFTDIASPPFDIEIRFDNFADTDTALARMTFPDTGGDDQGGNGSFNTDKTWHISADVAVPAGQFDFVSVLMHEIGHGIGLSHSSVDEDEAEDVNPVMVPGTSSGPSGVDRTLAVDDKVGASALYDEFVETSTGQAPQTRDIAVGGDGSVWIISNTSAGGGNHVVKKRSGNGPLVPVADNGSGTRIAVAPDGRPWVVSASGSIWRRTHSGTNTLDADGADWDRIAGCAKDIGIGSSTPLSVWVIGCDVVPGGFGMHKFVPCSGAGCPQPAGGVFVADNNPGAAAIRIAVDAGGKPWVVNDAGQIYARSLALHNSGNWDLVEGATATDISVGFGRYPWILGTDTVAGGHPIFVLNNQRESTIGDGDEGAASAVHEWIQRPGAATSIAVGPDSGSFSSNIAWLSNSELEMWKAGK